MNFKPAQCPSCGGSLQVPDDRTTVNCMYCGATIVVREAIQTAAAATVPNLLRLAQTALTSSNYQEAYEYFTRVLEIDSNNTHAWAGKAEAAGKMSSQHMFRMPEMLNYFGNALASASESQLSHMRNNASEVICAVVSEDYLRMRSAFSSSFFENATWAFYLNRVGELLMVLEDASRLIPTDIKVVQTIIWLCDQNTDRVYFNNTQGKQVRRAFDVGWNTSIRQKRSRYLEELYRLNPSLRPAPVVTANKTEGALINRNVASIGFGALILFALLLMIAALVRSPSTTNRPVSDGASASSTPTPIIPSAVNRSESQHTSQKTSPSPTGPTAQTTPYPMAEPIAKERSSDQALASFRKKLMSLPESDRLILSVEGSAVPGVARVQVSNMWFDAAPYQRRQITQLISNLWSAEMNGKTAILHIYDITGREVAGNKVFGGVWIEDE